MPKLEGDLADFITLVDALRARGARRVRWDALEVELAPLPTPVVSTPEPSRQDRERTAREGDERDLFWSAGGPVPAEAE